MKLKLFSFFLVFVFAKSVFAQKKLKIDSTKVNTLMQKEIKSIRNLLLSDTIKSNTSLLLVDEIYKINPNLIYKYRLDSIKSTVSLDYNEFVQQQITVFEAKRKGEIAKSIALGKYYFPIFEKALQAYRVPKEFKYLPIVESSMNPFAVSKSGAVGLWQFMFTTGKVYGLTIDNYIDERRDPIASSYAAAAYLREAYNEFNDWLLAAASYNCGIGCVRRAIVSAGGGKQTFWSIRDFLPNETKNYVPAFIASNYMMNYFDKYEDIEVDDELAPKTDSVYISNYLSLAKIAKAIDLEVQDLKILNPAYKKDVINGSLKNPKRLIIPKTAFKNYPNLFAILNSSEESSSSEIWNAAKVEGLDHPSLTSVHIVKSGENLTKLADKYKVEVQDLKVWNKLTNHVLVVGQKLVVRKPTEAYSKEPNQTKKPAYITYKVKVGDTLSEIAAKFENVTVSNIKEMNHLTNSLLTVGAILKIYLE